VRFLLANNHCISDPTAGVTQSLRTIVEWLADAGHECRILTTARFESPVTFTIEDHLGAQGVDVSGLASPHGPRRRPSTKRRGADRPVVHYTVGGVPVTMLLTRHNLHYYQQLMREIRTAIEGGGFAAWRAAFAAGAASIDVAAESDDG